MKTRSKHLLMLICISLLPAACEKEGEPPPDERLPGVPFVPIEISIKQHGDLMELLDESLVFVDKVGTEWIAPRGTLSDGASIPRLALTVTDGRFKREFLQAAVVHDAYCQEENETRTPEQYRKRTWQTTHRMFHEASLAGGTAPMLAKIMFAAVWLAGPRWDDLGSELDEVSSDALTRAFTGSKRWIEQNNPSIDEIVADMGHREPVLVQLYRLETGVQAALQAEDTARANALIREEEVLLSRELDRSQNDLMLLNFKGHLQKNRADLYLRINDEDRAINELGRSEQTFNQIIRSEPDDPGALQGLGTVSVLRGDLSRADEYTRRALRVAPDSEAARQNLRDIERLRRIPAPDPP